MSTKPIHNRYNQRRYHANNNRQRPDKRPVGRSPDQILSDLIQQFNFYCVSFRTKATFEFDNDEDNNHRCKMTLPVFPNLQSIGNGAKTKQEAKANAIIAFLAHMEKRKQVGLFVPYVIPSLLRNIQVELRRANVATPDLNLNVNEYLLADRIMPKREVKKNEKIIKIIERICGIRTVTLWQSPNMTFVYIVGSKSKEELIRPYVKALFQPENEQMFNYGEKLFDVFNDEYFVHNVCQRLKVLCDNHLEKCKLFIRGSSVNVQCCYNEFVVLRREFECDFHRNRKNLPPKTFLTSTTDELKNAMEHLESTRIEHVEKPPVEEKETDQLPDYSNYDDDVNASILTVLRNEDDDQEQTPTQDEPPKTTSDQPEIIELSDDSSDATDLQILQSVEPKIPKNTNQRQPPLTFPVIVPQPLKVRSQPMVEVPKVITHTPVTSVPSFSQSRVLRHIVLDGQNIARNSNDYSRTFSWSRLSNAINYFKNRGHQNIIAFLPLYYRDFTTKNVPLDDLMYENRIRDDLINSRYIAFTPSRYNNGQRLTNYDDRFILQYAADNDGVVVSNDNFRDLQYEKSFQFIIKNRILPFATINDTFMPATDPLGRNGPHLDAFLAKINL